MRSWDKADVISVETSLQMKGNPCYCPVWSKAGEDVPAGQEVWVISLWAFSQKETACSPCGMPGRAVHTMLMLIGTQWPVSVGLAALPELPQHLWAAWSGQLGAHRDSLLLPRGAAWAWGGGAAGNSNGQRVPAPTLQRKAKMYGKSRSCELSPGWA